MLILGSESKNKHEMQAYPTKIREAAATYAMTAVINLDFIIDGFPARIEENDRGYVMHELNSYLI